ncbi:hypothetical protein TWF730_002168 [Orbilia blumenaviensis]|uniref:SP-RING-type domain-containing protein n=1 Tax=Orbilia blumenaviensis TaxID=1796055 RepID=A0AAV9UHE2_9PEZI
MATIELDQSPQAAARYNEPTNNGQGTRVDTSVSTGPGRPSLTSPSLKRKSSISSSRADIDLANVNNTVSMFMGGRRHSWMQQGAGGTNSYTPMASPSKRVKTTPTKPQNSEPKPQTEGSQTPVHVSPPAPKLPPAPKENTAEPVVITIPDTQPEEQGATSQTLVMEVEQQQPVKDPPSNHVSVASPPTTCRSTPEIPLSIVSTPRPQVITDTILPTPVPAPIPNSITVGQPVLENPPKSIVESRESPVAIRASPAIETRASSVGSSISRMPFPPRDSSAEQLQPAPRIRPTLQTAIASVYMQNLTPPPSTSPVSATVINAVNELGLRSANPSSAMPSPAASPQMSDLSTIDLPKYLPDGSCKMHRVNIRRPTIEDHNLLLGELQRLGQQIKESQSPAPEKPLVMRYSKLNRALDAIRRQINQSSVQSTQELVSDILRRRTPSVSAYPSQSPVSSNPCSPTHQRLSIPQTERQHVMQSQHGAIQTNTMLPPLQPLNQHTSLPSTAHFRTPTVQTTQDADFYAQASSPAVPSHRTQSWYNPPSATDYPLSQIQQPIPSQFPASQSLAAQTTQAQPQLQLQPSGVSGPTSNHQKNPWSCAFVEKLHYLMAQPGTEPWKPNDSLRASLLESALKQGDDLFVALHLLFCHTDHPMLKNKYPFIWDDPRNKLGLELLSQLLFSNSTLSRRALSIFVQVPMDLGGARMKVPGFNDDMMAALKLLQDIRPIFDTLYNYCDSNKLSCPSQGLIASAGILSPSLQKTISVSLSQMLMQHAKPSQQLSQPQPQLPQNQVTSAPRQPQQLHAQSMRRIPQNIPLRKASSGSEVGPMQRAELQIITTDWGGKVPGWKLINEWRYLPADLQKPEGDTSEYFTYFRRCVTPVVKVSSRPQQLSFLVETALSKSYHKADRTEGIAPNVRPVRNWSKLYRLRCVASIQDLTQLTEPEDFSAWRSLETCWPMSIFAELQDKSALSSPNNPQERESTRRRRLHFRRKRYWGKDCTTDLTDGLEHGENTIQVVALDNPTIDGASYYVAVEEVEVADRNTLFQLITQTQSLSSNEAKELIISRLKKSADSIANDDDISVVEADTVTVSVTCPMSQQLIDIPVRGKDCQHLDCFDLNGYLASRTKFPSGFSVPDSWKCPICSRECTPATLMVDGFMKDTVSKLKEVQACGQYSNAKSVIIRSDGMWRPHDPPEATKTKIKKEMPEVISLLDD